MSKSNHWLDGIWNSDEGILHCCGQLGTDSETAKQVLLDTIKSRLDELELGEILSQLQDETCSAMFPPTDKNQVDLMDEVHTKATKDILRAVKEALEIK